MEQQEFVFSGETSTLPNEAVLHEVRAASSGEPFKVAFKAVRLRAEGGALFVVPVTFTQDACRPFAGFERKMLALVRGKFSRVKDEDMIRTTLKVCHVDDDATSIFFKFRLRDPAEAVDPEHVYNLTLALSGLKVKRTRVESLWPIDHIEVDVDLPPPEEEGAEDVVVPEPEPEPEPDDTDIARIRAEIEAGIAAEEAELQKRYQSLEALSGVLRHIKEALASGSMALDDAAAVLEEYQAVK